MPYPDDEAPDAAAAPSPFTAQSVYPAMPGATDPVAAREFLGRHLGEMAKREPEIQGNFNQMQLNVDSMTKMLDDTVNSIKAAKSGRSNLPMMAMGAGMMSNTGGIGSQLGAGFGAMVPTIQKQRETDEASDLSLAQLGMRKAMLQNAPLEAKLAYMKAMQLGDQTAARAIEQALIRAQATGTVSGADKLAQANEKLMQKSIGDAMKSAVDQVKNESTEMYATAEERRAAIAERFKEQIAILKASGVNIPEEKITQIVDSLRGTSADRGAISTQKSYFESPNTPESVEKTKSLGLPPPPNGYIYDMRGPKDRPKIVEQETANFRKESKDWDTQSKLASDNLANLDLAEQILDKKPKLTGPRTIGGIPLPNSWEYNKSPDARTLKGIFASSQVHNVPPGQGAVSDMERKLFADMGASMDNDAETNKRLIGLQKDVFKRDLDRRAFFNEYWNQYKTVDGMVTAWDRYIASPAGTVLGRDGAGNIVPNKNRLSWREYFRKERSPAGPDVPQTRGGPIKLGKEYD